MDKEEQHGEECQPDQQAENEYKQVDNQQSVKKRGTISLQNSNGPPQGFYHPDLSILTIGDGDLSFSLSVSEWVKYKYNKNVANFVATTYDSIEELQKLYKLNVKTNIKRLEANSVKVLHGVDVNQLDKEDVRDRIDPDRLGFDRIVWNFPHAGFPQKNYGPGFEWQQTFHQKHQKIISNFFNHSHLYLKPQGLILMAHKTIQPFSIWNIPNIAVENKYQVKETLKFDIDDYPGYENRRGAGRNGAKRFPIGDAVQYVFG